MLSDFLFPYFSHFGDVFCRSFFTTLQAITHCCSSNTATIARAMTTLNNKDFNTNDKAVSYLLNNNKFSVDEKFWRHYIKMIFGILKERNSLNKGDRIYIQVDFTSDCNDFLILSASIIFSGRAIPIYFTMRNYPKHKRQYDHKKMELAFLRGLKQCLSNKYQYVIVADRGFGNKRFFENCTSCNFDYVIRLQPNMKVNYKKNSGILGNIIRNNGKYSIYIKKWDLKTSVFKNEKNSSEWYIASNISELSFCYGVKIYEDRFKIEHCFRDLKSSGFDIESSKIKNYSRFKRLLALCVISQALMVITGDFIATHRPSLKKRFPMHTKLISAFLPLQNAYLQQCLKKP